MRGAGADEWLRVLQAESYRQHVYIFDPESKSVFHPGKELIPWDVVLLLGKFHKKFRLSRGMLPRVQDIMEYVNKFCNKLQWQWLSRGVNPVSLFHVSRSDLAPSSPPPSIDVAPELRCWTNFFTWQIRKACTRSLSRHSYNKQCWCNRTPLDTMAMAWLRDSQWAVVPTDKDGGYCLVPKEHIAESHSQILSKAWYYEYPVNALPTLRSLAREYGKLAGQVAVLEKNGSVARTINKSLVGGSDSLVRVLNVTVKSHKPNGLVTFRNIHGGLHYPFAGLGAWLAYRLRKGLAAHIHILRNTTDLVQQLKTFVSDVPIAFIKIDIKDYFMSGTREELREHGSRLLDVEGRLLGQRVIDFLLTYQFVKSDYLPHRVWQVCVGAGMGLNFSGELSDAAFFTMAEEWMLVEPGKLETFGVLKYWRFKDDILVIVKAECLQNFRECFQQMKQRAGSFALEVESISFNSVTFLDIDLWTAEHAHSHDRTTVSIRYKPHFKKTSLGVPLSCNSSHPWHVHASWPFAELRRLRRLSCDESTYENAKHIFVHRLMYSFEPSFLTKKLLEYAPPGLEVVKGVRSRELGDKGEEVKWIVLPFHFVWESACLTSVANKFLNSHEAQVLWAKAWGSTPSFKISVAWKTTTPPVATILKNLWRMDGEVAA